MYPSRYTSSRLRIREKVCRTDDLADPTNSDDPPPHAVAVTIQLPLIAARAPRLGANYLERMTSLQIGDIIIVESLATRYRPAPRGMIVDFDLPDLSPGVRVRSPDPVIAALMTTSDLATRTAIALYTGEVRAGNIHPT